LRNHLAADQRDPLGGFAMAKSLLTDPKRSVKEVAELLGYASPSFCRAFRRWSGETPRKWRRHNQVSTRGNTCSEMVHHSVVSDWFARAVLATHFADHEIERVMQRLPMTPAEDGTLRVRGNTLWEALAIELGDPSAGLHIAERLSLRNLELVWQFLRAASNMWQAFAGAQKLLPLIASDFDIAMVERDGVARFELCAPLVLHPLGAEFGLALALRVGRLLFDVQPTAILFRHAEPSDISAHHRFFACPVQFGCKLNAILFDAALLEVDHAHADATLQSILDAEAERRLQKLPPNDFEQSVRREYLLAAERGGESIATIAGHLGVSARVLQRQLRLVGLSHRELLDAARSDYAKSLLGYGGATVNETAQALGFSEPAAFVRTFRRWTGMTPGSYRRIRR
jgi:AraC-like DNA-binding protein